MAISFSRPDPSSPAAVGAASFPVSRRGYDQADVRDFLRMVAAELSRLQERERFLESEMRAMQTRGLSAPGRLDEETVTTLLGEEAARVLTAARDAATQIRERAEESATRLVKDAAEDAVRIRESATLEGQRLRDDAAADANAEVEMAKQQGRDMVNEARAYREKVLSELSRRRDAARGQIEQLLHGRDRLMSAFERARIATESVINELHDAHDEPETLVNLAPTTGPVPIVNPHHPSVAAYDQDVRNDLEQAVAHAQEIVRETSTNIDIPLESILEPVVEEVPSVDEGITETVEDSVIADSHDAGVHDSPMDVTVEVVESADVVEEPAEVRDTVAAPAVQTPAVESDETRPTNVVSLFERRKPQVPDVPGSAGQATENDHPVAPKKTDHSVDDIFAKLRAGSTAEVAKTTAAKVAADDAPAKSPEAPAATQPKAGKPASKTAKSPAKKFEMKADPARFAARDEAIAPVVTSLSRKFKRVLADEQNNVLEHLRNKRSSLEIDAMLGSAAEQSKRYSSSVADDAMTAAGAGVKSMKDARGTSKRVTQKAVDAAVAKAIAGGLVARFRQDVLVAIGEAEGDRQILSALIRDVYRSWKMTGIDENVDDVACAAHNAGAFLSLEPSASIVWQVDPKNPCCGDCADNALAGSVTKGSEFPTGDTHPMSHAGCRCLIAPAAQ